MVTTVIPNAVVSSLASIGEASRQEIASDETDCSNPQQGTGSSLACMAQSPPTASVGVGPGRVTSPLTTGDNMDRSVGTKRRAQEATGTRQTTHEQRSAYKFPPTAADNRKLFVGGLPMDGTSRASC
jgi:hypothetical protein